MIINQLKRSHTFGYKYHSKNVAARAWSTQCFRIWATNIHLPVLEHGKGHTFYIATKLTKVADWKSG